LKKGKKPEVGPGGRRKRPQAHFMMPCWKKTGPMGGAGTKKSRRSLGGERRKRVNPRLLYRRNKIREKQTRRKKKKGGIKWERGAKADKKEFGKSK